MREAQKEVFFAAAEQFTCWIGLREPNPLAEKWMGLAGYTPKSMACKAKTADNPSHRFGGLVVDPTKCPGAFKPESLKDATETWTREFLVGGQGPPMFTVVASGNELGVVKLQGKSLYADFDLMAINRASAEGQFLFTTLAEQKELFDKVEPFLNRGLSAPLIQHGAEFMWDQGVGAREFEYVLWFGPKRKFQRSPSSMPKGGH